MSTKIVVACPECHAKLKLKSRASLGKRRDCPRCGHSFELRESRDETKDERLADSVIPRRSSQTPVREKKTQTSKQRTVVFVAACVLAVGIIAGASTFFRGPDQANPTDQGEVTATDSTTVTRKKGKPRPVDTPEKDAEPSDRQRTQTEQPTSKVAEVASANNAAPTNPPTRQSSTPSSPAGQSGVNWPRFRGPDGSGVSNATGLPTTWSATKNIVWSRELPGPGSSSPITWGDHVYLTCYSGYGLSAESPGDMSKLKRHLVCVNRDDGKILWDRQMPAKAKQSNYVNFITNHGYASSTPTADATGVYVFYGATGAAQYSHAGQLKWQKSCGTQALGYGTAVSPILYRNLLIIHADVEGTGLIALDKSIGTEKWRLATNMDGRCNSTPVLVPANGSHELVFFADENKIAAVDPQSGKSLWTCETNINRYLNPSPITQDGIVYMLGGRPSGGVAVRAGGRGDVTRTHKPWEVNKGCTVGWPTYVNGYLYWVTNRGVVNCLDAKTGKLMYETRTRPSSELVYGSVIAADGKLYFFSREKGAYVAEVGPTWNQLAHNVIETDTTIFNATPAVSRGQLLIRSDKCLYCIGKKQ